MPLSQIQIWLLAIRPKTLPAAIAPVIIGTAMAFGDGLHHFPSAGLALCAALLIQIGTNLANDYFDYIKGTDTPERIGPVRVTQSGLIKPTIIKRAFFFVFLSALAITVTLLQRAGWPILVIGILSVLSGLFYTAGPRPLGYMGLGEIFVFIFFGPVAVTGTYYIQSLEINLAVILAGLAPGLLSSAILIVNNIRDIEGDAKANKRTLAVRFGRRFAQLEYMIVSLLAFLTPVIVFLLTEDHQNILYSVFLCLLLTPSIQMICCHQDGASLNLALSYTAKILIIYSLSFSLGWIL